MKTAISIPDRLFEASERLARQLGLSRSELYVRAMVAYLEQHRREHITEQLNRVYGEIPAALDTTIARMQFASFPEEKW
jgi:metal-responsive CopG/Arc/MetJ family transcriptional regulator